MIRSGNDLYNLSTVSLFKVFFLLSNHGISRRFKPKFGEMFCHFFPSTKQSQIQVTRPFAKRGRKTCQGHRIEGGGLMRSMGGGNVTFSILKELTSIDI